MAYEIGSGSKALTLPNPFKTHNYFLMAGAVGTLVAALWILVAVRGEMSDRHMVGIPYAVGIAGTLLVASLGAFYTVLNQIKFYFGRARPVDLTRTMHPDYIKETLKQQALIYEEPQGPIAGALMAAIPNLMYAPPPIRHMAQWQFKKGMTLAALLVSLVITLLLNDTHTISGQAISEYIGYGFLAYALLVVFRPLPEFNRSNGPLDVLSVKHAAALVIFVFLGPIAVSVFTPPIWRAPSDLIGLSPYPHVFVFMVLALALYGLFLFAMVRQLLPPPPTAVSSIQEAWNLSINPALIMGEFARVMQDEWRSKIPNRAYAKVDPQVELNQTAGTFFGEALEETQPFPRAAIADDIVTVARQRGTILCLALDACGSILTIGFAVAAVLLARKVLDGVRSYHDIGDVASYALYTVILGALGRYAFSAAYHLWRRFDFESRVIWLEMGGQYVSGRVEQGNLMQSSLRASTAMVQVEGMTFRLRVADIHTMAYGKDSARYVVSMMGAPDAAQALRNRLAEFVDNQASVANLGTTANARRMAATLSIGNQAAAAAQGQLSSPAPTNVAAVLPVDAGDVR